MISYAYHPADRTDTIIFWPFWNSEQSDYRKVLVLMKDKFYRFFWVEHPTGMMLATILITLGRGQVKKQITDPLKYKRAFWFFLLALLIILATIPWPGREIVGRGL